MSLGRERKRPKGTPQRKQNVKTLARSRRSGLLHYETLKPVACNSQTPTRKKRQRRCHANWNPYSETCPQSQV